MAFRFPFSTLHELNLDWILEKVKTFAELIPPMETAVEDVQSLSTDVQQAVEDAQQALEDAGEALQTAEEAKEIAEQAAQGTIADGAVTTAKLDDDAVTTEKISDGAVTGAKIASGTIQTGNLSSGCVTTTQILDGTISPDDLGTECVTNSKLGASAVTTGKIDDGAVTTAKLGAGAVTNSKIADGAINLAKLGSDVNQKFVDVRILQFSLPSTINVAAYSLQEIYTNEDITLLTPAVGTIPTNETLVGAIFMAATGGFFSQSDVFVNNGLLSLKVLNGTSSAHSIGYVRLLTFWNPNS